MYQVENLDPTRLLGLLQSGPMRTSIHNHPVWRKHERRTYRDPASTIRTFEIVPELSDLNFPGIHLTLDGDVQYETLDWLQDTWAECIDHALTSPM